MIKLENVNKYFNKHKKNEIHVINNTSIELEDSGLVALLGPSGCGKTTLLNAIGGLDKINNGKIFINGQRISKRSSSKIDKIRNLNIGYIFQDFNLVDDMSVYENVALSLLINGIKDKNEIKKRVEFVLEKVGLYKYRNKFTSMLSGGQRQRVAIARAIVKDPDIIIADEPTGNLDSKNTIEVMNIIKAISKSRIVILVTHETELADFYATRIISIEDGKVISDVKNEHNNDLDYRMDNKIYLKDFEIKDSYEGNNIQIDYYNDNTKNVKLNIVVKNGNIYIKGNNNYKIEVVDNNSSIEFVNDTYKKINTTIFDEYNFDFDNIIDKNIKMKYSSIFNVFKLLKNGFKKVLNYSIIKKLLLGGFFASGLFITYSMSSLFGINKINDNNFVTVNKNYLIVETNKIKKDDYEKFQKDKNINYIIPGRSIVSFNVPLKDYYQTLNASTVYSGSLASTDLLKTSDLLYGKLPSNEKEIVIDIIVYNNELKNSSNSKQAGILNYEELVSRKFKTSNDEYTLVGIVDTKNPSIYADKNEFVNIISNTKNINEDNYYYDDAIINENDSLYDYELYKDKIKMVKGHLPKKDYEVIINENLEYEYPLNKKMDYKVNGNKLTVVGYYKDNMNLNGYLVTNKTVEYSLLDDMSNIIIYSKDKNLTLNEYKGKYNIKDTYEYSKSEYIKDKKTSNKSTIIISIFILTISLIEIYLMVRSSFLSRIKEVGILRAIGMKKLDIYKMFSGEIIAISTLACMPGVLIMSYILNSLSKISLMSDKFIMNPIVFIIIVVFIYLFNLLIGLLPVYKTIRKTPAEILSRYDL